MKIDEYLEELFDKDMSLADKIDSLKTSLILSAIEKEKGNLSKAAKVVDLERTAMTKYLARTIKKKKKPSPV